ncbi:hypothetical protein [Fontibacter flavus]|uniref:Uncharacterized protein n=1 Tax=Fontibacter flavus TaxID=654838 RepID=A0ABV6FQW0_9BACT
MLYLLWVVLNITLVLGLFILFFDWLGFVKSRFGWFIAILVGLISLGAITNGQKKISEQEKEIISPCLTENGVNYEGYRGFERLALESNLIQTVYFDYFLCNSQKEVNVSALTPLGVSLSGLVLGFDWETNHILKINGPEDEGLEYKIHGRINWKLLGLQIFAQSKEYEVVLN